MLRQPQLQKAGILMDIWAKLLVSAVPVVCETFILQEMYVALYKENADLRRRVIIGLLFIAVQYPIVFLTDNAEFFAHLGVFRSILIFLLYALMLLAVFRGGFLSRCLPAAAVFTFISVVLETLMWFSASRMGLDIALIRYTLWKVLLFQGILYTAEMSAVLLLKRIKFTAGYPEKISRKIWLPTTGYLVVISVFWIGLIQQVGTRFKSGTIGPWDIAGIITCLLVSLLFIKSSMDISREIERRQCEIEAQKLELDYQKIYNSGMEAMLSELSRFRHNYSNTLAALKGYAEAGNFLQLKEYIGELCSNRNIAFSLNREALAEINNGALAGLLAAKMLQSESNHINFKLSTSGKLEPFKIKTVIVCEMLGILLDNAVEAAAASADKYVRVNVNSTGSGTIFRIENSVDKTPNIPHMYEKGYTTKPGGGGIGLHILEGILQKYPDSSLNTFADEKRVVQELCIY